MHPPELNREMLAILRDLREFFRHNIPAHPSSIDDSGRTLKERVADAIANAERTEDPEPPTIFLPTDT